MSDGNSPTTETGTGSGDAAKSAPTFTTWEEFIGGQDPAVKNLHEEHTKGLKSALDAERSQRETLAKQLNDAAKLLEKGSEARTQLESAIAENTKATAKLAAYETLHAAQVKDIKLAYLAAESSGLIDAHGNLKIEALRETHPLLFGEKLVPKGNAGTGTDTPAIEDVKVDMNMFVRGGRG